MARRKKPRCPPPAADYVDAVDERESGLDLGIMGEPSAEPAAPAIAPMPEPRVVVMHSRREAGVPPARRPNAKLRRSEGMVIHCTAGRRPEQPGDVPSILRSIHAYHVRSRGWVDWGYHWAVDPWGHVWQMLGWGLVGRHAKTAGRSLNLRSHGIVVFGKGDELTELEHGALLAMVGEHDRRYGHGFVVGHRDVSRKSCPGPAVYQQVVEPLARPLSP